MADFIQPPDFAGPGEFDITDIETLYPNAGQINVYEVSVTNASGQLVHFDLYNHIDGKNKAKAKFAPFSHDAHVVPEPTSGIVWLLVGLTWAGLARGCRHRSRRRQRGQRRGVLVSAPHTVSLMPACRKLPLNSLVAPRKNSPPERTFLVSFFPRILFLFVRIRLASA